MTPQERDVIQGIFDRLRQAERSVRDPEAETFIAERLKQQPYAPYVMAQQIFAQEQALSSLQQRIQELEAELQQARNQRPQQGGFLSGIFGGGQQAAPPPPQARPGGPWGQQGGYAPPPPQPGYAPPPPQAGPWGGQPSQGGGFLASAATTALGVAGGVMIANALSNAFSHHGSSSAFADAGTANIMPLSNNSYADPPAADTVNYQRNGDDYDDGDSYDDGGGSDMSDA